MVSVHVGREQVAVDRAAKMIDIDLQREAVQVEAAKVQVAEKQVEVDRRALEYKEKFGRAGIELQIELRRIEAEEHVRAEMARSVGQFMSRGEFQVFGSPDTMSQMMGQFTRGLGFGTFVDGLNKGTNGGVDKLVDQGGQLLGTLVEKLTGKRLTEAQVAEAKRVMSDGLKAANGGGATPAADKADDPV